LFANAWPRLADVAGEEIRPVVFEGRVIAPLRIAPDRSNLLMRTRLRSAQRYKHDLVLPAIPNHRQVLPACGGGHHAGRRRAGRLEPLLFETPRPAYVPPAHSRMT